MPNLLHVDSSIRTEGSQSRDLAARFVKIWQAGEGDRSVTYRDLSVTPPPHLTWAAFTAAMQPPDTHSEEQALAAKEREELIVELEQADALLLSVPMYNWSIPSTLKAWIDNVLVMGRTADRAGGPGVLTGKPVTVIAAQGGGYGPGTPREASDHQRPYLRTVLTALGAPDAHFVTVDLTLAATNPAMAELVGLAEEARATAERAVAERAAAA